MDTKVYGPKVFKRCELGLLDSPSVNYVFNEYGMIDWRKMVRTEHLVANRSNFEKRRQPIPSSTVGLEDRDLLIVLAGIKELAQIRGFSSVKYSLTSPSPDYIAAVCEIVWVPNYETEGKPVTFSAVGDATPFNTQSFARLYLGPIAENRSFVRCVRNFLKINIVSQEEIGAKIIEEAFSAGDNPTEPKFLLESVMKEKGISMESIKSKLIKENYEGAENISDLSQLSKTKIFELIERIKKVGPK